MNAFHVAPEARQGGTLPGTLTLLGGTLLVVLLIADEAGFGPRHSSWRGRWIARLMRR